MVLVCNISKKDRWTRVIFGSVFIIAILLNFSNRFILILSIIMVIEGLIGWCTIGYIYDKIKLRK
jgi:hypothetical protein